MKTKFLSILAMAAAIFAFSACEPDEESSSSVDYAVAVAGQYSGYVVASSAYFSASNYDGATVVISVAGENLVDVSLSNDTWGTYSVESAAVSNDGSNTVIALTEGLGEMASHSGGSSNYDCTIEGSISAAGVCSLTVSVPSVMGGTTLVFVQGEMPAEEEEEANEEEEEAEAEAEDDSIGAEIAGSYAGYTQTSFPYISYNMYYEDESVEIESNGDGTVNVTLVSATWGTYAVENVEVTYEDGKYSLASASGVVEMASHSGSSNYDFVLSGSVSSAGVVKVKAYLESVMGGTTVNFKSGELAKAECIEGVYEGYHTVGCAYFSDYIYDGITVTIEVASDNAVNVTVVDENWGTYAIEGAEVSLENTVFTVAQAKGQVEMSSHGSTASYDFTMDVTVSAGKASVSISVPDVMGGTTLVFTEGSAPVDDSTEESAE